MTKKQQREYSVEVLRMARDGRLTNDEYYNYCNMINSKTKKEKNTSQDVIKLGVQITLWILQSGLAIGASALVIFGILGYFISCVGPM